MDWSLGSLCNTRYQMTRERIVCEVDRWSAHRHRCENELGQLAGWLSATGRARSRHFGSVPGHATQRTKALAVRCRITLVRVNQPINDSGTRWRPGISKGAAPHGVSLGQGQGLAPGVRPHGQRNASSKAQSMYVFQVLRQAKCPMRSQVMASTALIA